jgi:hypothetical protein
MVPEVDDGCHGHLNLQTFEIAGARVPETNFLRIGSVNSLEDVRIFVFFCFMCPDFLQDQKAYWLSHWKAEVGDVPLLGSALSTV